MYKQVESPEFFINEFGKKIKPFASMQCNEFCGVTHIWKDDSCYIVYEKHKDH